MAFENINVGSLRSSLISCKDSINSNISANLGSKIINSDIWHCNCRNNLYSSLMVLENLYKNLRGKIDHYLSLVNYIENYQNLVSENQNLEKEYKSLEPRLYRDEEYVVHYYDNENQCWASDTATRTVLDTNVQNRMNDISNQIKSNENDMRSIQNTISNSI